jgi:hypothetical protein
VGLYGLYVGLYRLYVGLYRLLWTFVDFCGLLWTTVHRICTTTNPASHHNEGITNENIPGRETRHPTSSILEQQQHSRNQSF